MLLKPRLSRAGLQYTRDRMAALGYHNIPTAPGNYCKSNQEYFEAAKRERLITDEEFQVIRGSYNDIGWFND